MRYLITGGAGFIGSHLAEELLRRGHEVYVVDDLSTGSINNIRHLKTHDRFHYTIDSCSNRALMAELVDGCDKVYHLAAAVGVKLIVESPVRTIETNIRLTEIVLDAGQQEEAADLRRLDERGLRQVATSSPSARTATWSWAPPTRAAGRTRAARRSTSSSPSPTGRRRSCRPSSARLFNTVGPRQTGQYGMVVPNFVRQALANEPITVFGDGKQSRCFTHVSDVVRALIGLHGQRSQPTARSSTSATTARSRSAISPSRSARCASSKSEIVHIPYEKAYEEGFEDMPRRVPDLSKIGAAIGWKPTIDAAADLDRRHRVSAPRRCLIMASRARTATKTKVVRSTY